MSLPSISRSVGLSSSGGVSSSSLSVGLSRSGSIGSSSTSSLSHAEIDDLMDFVVEARARPSPHPPRSSSSSSGVFVSRDDEIDDAINFVAELEDIMDFVADPSHRANRQTQASLNEFFPTHFPDPLRIGP